MTDNCVGVLFCFSIFELCCGSFRYERTQGELVGLVDELALLVFDDSEFLAKFTQAPRGLRQFALK
jgi:hypothetical protein